MHSHMTQKIEYIRKTANRNNKQEKIAIKILGTILQRTIK